jgi:hypothetical protein
MGAVRDRGVHRVPDDQRLSARRRRRKSTDGCETRRCAQLRPPASRRRPT